MAAYGTIKYDEKADLAMSEARLHLDYRVPDEQRLEWARRIVDGMGDRPPKDSQRKSTRASRSSSTSGSPPISWFRPCGR